MKIFKRKCDGQVHAKNRMVVMGKDLNELGLTRLLRRRTGREIYQNCNCNWRPLRVEIMGNNHCKSGILTRWIRLLLFIRK